jgi:hypothetical protein
MENILCFEEKCCVFRYEAKHVFRMQSISKVNVNSKFAGNISQERQYVNQRNNKRKLRGRKAIVSDASTVFGRRIGVYVSMCVMPRIMGLTLMEHFQKTENEFFRLPEGEYPFNIAAVAV